MQRLTPEERPANPVSRYITVNVPRDQYQRLRTLADSERVAVHKIIDGLINFYEANAEDE